MERDDRRDRALHYKNLPKNKTGPGNGLKKFRDKKNPRANNHGRRRCAERSRRKVEPDAKVWVDHHTTSWWDSRVRPPTLYMC